MAGTVRQFKIISRVCSLVVFADWQGLSCRIDIILVGAPPRAGWWMKRISTNAAHGHGVFLSGQMMIWLGILQTCFFVLMSPPSEDFPDSGLSLYMPRLSKTYDSYEYMMYLYMQHVIHLQIYNEICNV